MALSTSTDRMRSLRAKQKEQLAKKGTDRESMSTAKEEESRKQEQESR